MPIKKITLNGRYGGRKVAYRFKVDIGPDPVTGKRRQETHTYYTAKQAKDEYARIINQTAEGTYVARTNITVKEFIQEWYEHVTMDAEEATKVSYWKALHPVRERLGSRRLQSVSEKDVRDLVYWMVTEGKNDGTPLAASTASLTLERLRAVMREAVRRKFINRDVTDGVKIPKGARKEEHKKKKARQQQIWDVNDVKGFLAAIRRQRLFAVMLLSLMGLRPAEVCGLRWDEDVDLDANVLRVGENTRTVVKGRVVEKAAKSVAGQRGLPLPGPVSAALKALKARQAAEKLAAGEAYVDSGYVVVDELGRPPTRATTWLRLEAYKLMAAAGVRQVLLYDARHACLTFLNRSGVSDVVLAAWAGHTKASFTKLTYVHALPEHLSDAADRLDILFADDGDGTDAVPA